MSHHTIEKVTWFEDKAAIEKGEPGLWNSFIGALATALRARGAVVDPIWLMGASGFAFRVYVHRDLCPSAMSVFDWDLLLPEAVEQAGYHCEYVGRYWHEDGVRDQRRAEAQQLIVDSVDQGRPAIVWDVGLPEWGVIYGYEDEPGHYHALSCLGKREMMPYEQLGEREVKVLSVAVPGEPNDRPRQEIIRRSIEAAVRHARGEEWQAREEGYCDGPHALSVWAEALEKGHASEPSWAFTDYYAATHCAASCYARDYLQKIAGGDPPLLAASAAYGRAAVELKVVWRTFMRSKKPDEATLFTTREHIRRAQAAVEKGVLALEEYLRASREVPVLA